MAVARNVKTFRGADRRKIKKLLQCLKAVQARDVLAMNTLKRTTAISTRVLVLDFGSEPQPLWDGATALIARMENALALTHVV